MTLANLNDLAQIIGAAGVIASLIFVGVQMRQNTRAVRAQMSQAHAATYQGMMRGIYQSAELTNIWITGMYSPEKLTDTERMQFTMFLAAAFGFWDACYIQYREGQLPEAHWHSMERMIVDMRGNPRGTRMVGTSQGNHVTRIPELVRGPGFRRLLTLPKAVRGGFRQGERAIMILRRVVASSR